MPRRRGIRSMALVQRFAIGDGELIRVFDDVGIDRTDIQMDSRV